MAREYKDITLNFGSLAEFSRHIAAGKTQLPFIEDEKSTAESDWRTDFTGTANYEEADQLMRGGDNKSFELLKKNGFETDTKKYNFGQRRKITPAVVGFAPIVPNAIAGVPVAMQQIKMQQAKTKIVDVVLSVSYNGDIDKEDFAAFAAKVLNGCLSLEKKGYRVNLYLFLGSYVYTNKKSYTCQNLTCTLKIKDSKTALDPLAVAYPVINSSFLRRHLFRLIEITPGLCNKFYPGYGSAIRDTKSYLPGQLKNALTFEYYNKHNIEKIFAGVK